MTHKRPSKKLSLNSQTVRFLCDKELSHVCGGESEATCGPTTKLGGPATLLTCSPE